MEKVQAWNNVKLAIHKHERFKTQPSSSRVDKEMLMNSLDFHRFFMLLFSHFSRILLK